MNFYLKIYYLRYPYNVNKDLKNMITTKKLHLSIIWEYYQ